MIYLIVYLLDVYPSFLGLLMVSAIFVLAIYGIKQIIMFIAKEAYERYKQDPNSTTRATREAYQWYLLAEWIPIKSYYVMILLALGVFLPSKNGLYIFTGLYIGEKAIDKMQESPLYDKAYKLAEAKLNELLDEASLKLEDKKNGSKK